MGVVNGLFREGLGRNWDNPTITVYVTLILQRYILNEKHSLEWCIRYSPVETPTAFSVLYQYGTFLAISPVVLRPKLDAEMLIERRTRAQFSVRVGPGSKEGD